MTYNDDYEREEGMPTGEEEAVDEEFEEFEDDGDEDGEGVEDDRSYRSQAEVDAAIERRLARERRNLAKKLGFDSLDEAAEYASAGRAVAGASGLTPSQVRQRLAEQAAQHVQQGGQVPAQYAGLDIHKELREMRDLIEDDRTEKVKAKQEEAARKEFGKLFDTHRDEIEDKAEETGLSIVDAAAVVLRPKLRKHIEDTVTKKKQVQKKRKIESGDGKPATAVNYESALTESERRIAQKMGLSLEKYYKRKKQLGEIE